MIIIVIGNVVIRNYREFSKIVPRISPKCRHYWEL